MTRRRSIRRRLLTDQTLVILLLGGAILATTFFGARRAVEALSGAAIRQAAERAESELRRFFDPVVATLLALRSWGEAGLLTDDAPRRFSDLATPLAERLPQVSGILVADDHGREHFLVRGASGWRSRETRVEEWGGRSRWLDWRGGKAAPEERWEELGYDPRTRPWFTGAPRHAPVRRHRHRDFQSQRSDILHQTRSDLLEPGARG